MQIAGATATILRQSTKTVGSFDADAGGIMKTPRKRNERKEPAGRGGKALQRLRQFEREREIAPAEDLPAPARRDAPARRRKQGRATGRRKQTS